MMDVRKYRMPRVGNMVKKIELIRNDYGFDIEFELKDAQGNLLSLLNDQVHDSGTAESGTVNTLTDTEKQWTPDEWANYRVLITDGTGKGQERIIGSNTVDTLTVTVNFDTVPDATSKYEIRNDSTVKFKMALKGAVSLKVDGTCTITDATNGKCKYTFQPTDLDTEGEYDAELELVYSAPGAKVISATGLVIKVIPDLPET